MQAASTYFLLSNFGLIANFTVEGSGDVASRLSAIGPV